MFNIKGKYFTKEPGLEYFKQQIGSNEHTYRQGKVNTIHKHLLREHSVNKRLAETFTFKNKQFVPAAIVLQGMKTVINFHTAYLLGNPVTITGTPSAVEVLNKCYTGNETIPSNTQK